MKATQVSIFYLLVLFASALIPVFGTPTPNCNVGRLCPDIVARDDTAVAELTASANATIKYIQTHVAEINKKSICFYSGYTMIDGQKVFAWQKIPDFKKVYDIHILNDIIQDAGQTSTDWQSEDWTEASRTLAQNAKDPIFVLLGQQISARSVYLNTEFPTLIENDDITKPVSAYELEGDGNFVPIK